MFGGGEEYFREPEPVDRETLKRFAIFCNRLRSLERPGVKAITDACEKARAVGDTGVARELVVGALLRHVKAWKGTKQLCYWYVLDKLCKEGKDTFGFITQPYILDIASDYIPFEDPALVEKYENMIERWDAVFNRSVIDRIWIAKKEKLWAVAHPEEIERARKAEEAEWQLEELRQQDQDGLDDYGQPCMNYLQGRCTWGSECKQLHPPGLEGSLPLECRLGDWKCRCGVINRHFRRRCSQCVREKPQYRRHYEKAPEEELLSHPDEQLEDILSQQFGYNPMSDIEAVAHWKLRLDGVSLEQFRQERSAAYRVRILGQKPRTPLQQQAAFQQNFAAASLAADALTSVTSDVEPRRKARRMESLIPSGLPIPESITLLSKLILERGAHDVHVPQALCQCCSLLKELGPLSLTELQGEAFFGMCKMIFSFWNTAKHPSAELFFSDIQGLYRSIGLNKAHTESLRLMVQAVTQK